MAAVFNNFYQIQPGDNIKPSEPTKVLMGYDEHTLDIIPSLIGAVV
ncbi:MAG: hypothetical protein ACREDR_05720 [Blastocatellia bacterium]